MTVTSALLLSLPALAEDDPRRAAVLARAERELESAREEPAWKTEITRALEKRMSFEFAETPLCEAVEHLAGKTGVNMILDRQDTEDAKHTPITLKVTDMRLGIALDWILKLADLEYTLKDEAVFITTHVSHGCYILLKIYDVRDFVAATRDTPAPLSLAGLLGRATLLQGESDLEGEHLVGSLAEMIMSSVHPSSWGAELGTGIEVSGGRLVIMQRPVVHRLIGEFLAALRGDRAYQVRVEARLVAAAEPLLEELSALSKPGEGAIYLTRAQLNLMAGALMDGKQAELVHAASLTCFNGQRNYTHAGEQVEYFSNMDKKHRAAFLGTVLDVRPLVSFDRKYVTVDVRICRTEPAREAVFPARVHRFRSTITCLDTDTVMIAGASMSKEEGKPHRRLVALVTPSILRLEPPKADRPPRRQSPAATKPGAGSGARASD
jgi:hypothetical protein